MDNRGAFGYCAFYKREGRDIVKSNLLVGLLEYGGWLLPQIACAIRQGKTYCRAAGVKKRLAVKVVAPGRDNPHNRGQHWRTLWGVDNYHN